MAAKLDHRDHPDANHIFAFTDVLYEDADCYRFLIESVANILGRKLNWTVPRAEEFPDYRVSPDTPIEVYAGNPEWRAFLSQLREDAVRALPELSWQVEGRDPWEVFRDERLLGNSRMDPCSRVLKRELRDRWVRENFDPIATTITVGIGPDERHRFDDGNGRGFRPRMEARGWKAVAPLLDTFEGEVGPLLWMDKEGLRRPRLYRQNYSHNNCGGFCVKAGQAHWRNRWLEQPERYAYDMMMEQKLRAYLGADVSMMSDRTGGTGKRPLTLARFAERLATNPQADIFYEPGTSGCGCAIDEEAA